MPGLFGLVVIDPQKTVPREQCEHILRKMADKLRHQNFYANDEWWDPSGKSAVGRIGHEHLIGTPFLADGPKGTKYETRFYGVLERSPDPGDADLAKEDNPLLGFSDSRGTFSGISFALPLPLSLTIFVGTGAASAVDDPVAGVTIFGHSQMRA